MFIRWAVYLLATCASAETFPPAEIKFLGPIDYGQTSAPVHYSSSPKYRALEFNAKPGDHLEIWVHSRRGAPKAYLTDSSFQSIAGGNSRFSTTIPKDRAPATYFIVFYDAKFRSVEFTVELQRPSRSN